MKKEFISVLSQEFEDFLTLRESEGHNSRKERGTLITLDRHLFSESYTDKNLSPTVIEGWLESLRQEMSINTKIVYISHYRQFATYLTSLGYTAFIPERPMEDKQYTPYIFSEDEQRILVESADLEFEKSNKNGKRGSASFAILIRILIGCGCRLGEILSLRTEDVNLDNGILRLRNTKGHKERLIPMHHTLVSVLKIYEKSGIPDSDGLFFPNANGGPHSQDWARYHFNRVLRIAGIEKPALKRYERNICVHCLRHSFAVTTFRRLNKAGYDMYNEIPVLSTYMGHDRIYGTEKYLHMTTENSEDILEMMEQFNAGVFPEVPE